MRLAVGDLEMSSWGEASPLPPIVLLHEGLGSVGLWREFPRELASRTSRRVFAYSRFGHGASDPPKAPHTIWFMHEEARLLPAVLDAAQIERAVLFGHSDGGSIALVTAAEHPDRVEALVLEAPHVFVEDVSIASIEATTRAYETGTLRARLARHHQDVDAAFHGWSDVWLDPEFLAWNLEAYLPRVRCPALLIQGVDDEYGTLAQVDAIERQATGSVKRLVLERCGHSPHKDQPEAVLSAVPRFLAGLQDSLRS